MEIDKQIQPKDIGIRIKFLRTNTLAITQDQFAKSINISRSNLCNIETGRINVTNRVINDICSVYGVSESWLYTGKGEIYANTENVYLLESHTDVNTRIRTLRLHLKLSQTAFGSEIGVGRGVIYNIEKNLVPAKPLLIQQICKTFNVNRIWLTTGNGEIFENTPAPNEITQFVDDVLRECDTSFKKRLLITLSKLSSDQWTTLEKIMNDIILRENI